MSIPKKQIFRGFLRFVGCSLSTVNCQLSTVPLYSELLAAALRYRYPTHKVFPHGALLVANTPDF
ncbi:hypothetical protein [Dolichospermum flos-aquae]|uniref:Uncharacterized protein n=1 Tax=Dolichospermum flos-aquae LEGE 04289 TaxID=1828708 RepID=A0ACC5Q6R0_DOLFA|nr:hypothetical protein [Dolichospermum flos-aquae]MBE9220669.1 hypothetical protein [Dolichospermum flos-aquae LEGE 04289]